MTVMKSIEYRAATEHDSPFARMKSLLHGHVWEGRVTRKQVITLKIQPKGKLTAVITRKKTTTSQMKIKYRKFVFTCSTRLDG